MPIMDVHADIEDKVFLSDYVEFRHPHIHSSVVMQITMIGAAILILLGIIYVITVLIVIAIHHLLYDYDAGRIPEYVKRSIQFSSEEEGEEKPVMHLEIRRKSLPRKIILRRPSLVSVSSSETENERVGPTASKKGDILEKFLHDGDKRH